MDAKMLQLFLTETWATLYMTALSFAVSYLIGIPLGVILVVTSRDGIAPNPWVEKILGFVINILRSIPFLILLIMVMPITMLMVGTTIGSKAVIPPLIFSAAPYIARMVESSLKEVDGGVIEAAKSMGASTWQIIWKVLLPEARPSLLIGAAITMTTIIGYSAMAGIVGGGGLGAIAMNYGYYRYQFDIMLVSVVLLVLIVQLIQEIWMRIARSSDKRIR